MYHLAEVRNAAMQAAELTITRLTEFPEDTLVTNEDLLRMTDLVPPTVDEPPHLHRTWGFNLIYLRETWRNEILERTGRYPRTVHGQGFLVLKPHQNLEHVDTKILDDVANVIKKGLRIVRLTRDSDLDTQNRQRKIASELRFSQLKAAARSARMQANRDRNWRNDTSDHPQPTPSTEDNQS